MPEGHVILRAAKRLAAGLEGERIVRVTARGPDLVAARARQRLEGAVLTAAEPRGKWLMIHFDNGMSLLSHLRMDGAWHVYRSGERWRRSGRSAWVVLDSGRWQGVNFDGPILELHRTSELLRDARITELGPDILAAGFDDVEYVRRMRTAPDAQLGDALMRQRLVCGIGNIYKNETLFLTGTSPWQTVAQTPDELLLRMREVCSKIMLEGTLDPRAITYHGPGPVGRWVYGRTGEACRSCGARIQTAHQGDEQRITWWCPLCQP
jgi:endonuclease-8